MNKELVGKFNNHTFTRGSTILKTKYYNLQKLIIQHLPIKEKVKKMEINRLRNGLIVDVLTSVGIQENVKFGGNVVKVHEGANCRKKFKKSPFKKVFDEFIELRQKYK